MSRYNLLLLLFLILLSVKNVYGLHYEDVVGGHEAQEGEFLYQVSINIKTNSFDPYTAICGGAIIDGYFVLTTAHCFIDDFGTFIERWYEIHVGTRNLEDNSGHVIDLEVIYIHKLYNWNTYDNDIAVLKLQIHLGTLGNFHFMKLQLPNSDFSFAEEIAIVSGYGFHWMQVIVNQNNHTVSTRGGTNLKLRYLHVRVLSNEVCEQLSNAHIPPSKVCGLSIPKYAGQPSGACKGDSGGPLTHGNTVIGILSTVYSNCSDNIKPAKYTRVSSFILFIQNIIDGNPSEDTQIFVNPN